MTVQKQAWDEVGERFDTVGKHVRARMRDLDTSTTKDRKAFEHSVRSMFNALEGGVNDARAAITDPTVYRDLSKLTRSLRRALDATLQTSAARVRATLPTAVEHGNGRAVKSTASARPAKSVSGTKKKAARTKATATKGTATKGTTTKSKAKVKV